MLIKRFWDQLGAQLSWNKNYAILLVHFLNRTNRIAWFWVRLSWAPYWSQKCFINIVQENLTNNKDSGDRPAQDVDLVWYPDAHRPLYGDGNKYPCRHRGAVKRHVVQELAGEPAWCARVGVRHVTYPEFQSGSGQDDNVGYGERWEEAGCRSLSTSS